MPTAPMPIRMEQELLDLLAQGARLTPHKKQELVRLTLRRHLQQVIEAESTKAQPGRLTTLQPWPKEALAAAYKKAANKAWDRIENAAVAAQGKPGFED